MMGTGTFRDDFKLVDGMLVDWGVSIRRACQALRFDTSSYHYKSRRIGQAGLELRIREICESGVPMVTGVSTCCFGGRAGVWTSIKRAGFTVSWAFSYATSRHEPPWV